VRINGIRLGKMNVPALRARSLAAALHFLFSMFVAGVVAAIVLPLWYPVAYRNVAGGWTLFSLLLGIHVCMGPLMTFMVFDEQKSPAILKQDLILVIFLQFAALIYGISVAGEARPVALVFAVDRFTLVTANNVRQEELPHTAPEYRYLPWSSLWMLATRRSTANETFDAVVLAAEGYDLAQRPWYWEPLSIHQQQAYLRGRPLSTLLSQHSLLEPEFCKMYLPLACVANEVRFLPLEARAESWVVLMGPAGKVLGFAPFDGFE
jgi:hypothetical protein